MHTRGSWSVSKTATDFERVIRGPKDEYVARLGENSTGWPDNARLIAAAPDLLRALRELVIESGGNAIPNSNLTAARDRAIAEIAKAEGGK